MGDHPGFIYPDTPVTLVDSVYALSGYETDSSGVQSVGENARKYIAESIKNGIVWETADIQYLKENRLDTTIYDLGFHYSKINNGTVKNDFYRFIQAIKAKSELSSIDSIWLNYSLAPINRDGFRSIDFKKHATDKTKVFLIGDSFTWGNSATNKTNSFSDVLASKGYMVYNASLVGADPMQYQLMLEQYFDKINPDIVVVNFFMGNDIMKFQRIGKPYQPLFVTTNAGQLFMCPHGISFNTPQEAYEMMIRLFTIPNQKINLFNYWMAKTRLTTRIWVSLAELGLVSRQSDEKAKTYLANQNKILDNQLSVRYLKEIVKFCETKNTKCMIVLIPEFDKPQFSAIKDYRIDFEQLPIVKPQHFELSDYAFDHHFNDDGHKKYADYLDSLISSSGK